MANLPRLNNITIPVIDVTALRLGGDREAVAQQIRQACCETGFFYIVGHGVDEALQQRLENLSRQFFAQDLETKMQIRMALGGRAWRGYFPVGDELTSGKPDLKEGIYFGAELDSHHPSARQKLPMHGANLFPNIPQFRETILDYLSVMTQLGHTLIEGIALSLGLEASYFHDRYTNDPLILFRIFNYPSDVVASTGWGVGEHTDYGLLTILKQDNAGGLQVRSRLGWVDAPPIANSFVCNIGDMLERLTGGLYRSTPHRVKNSSGRDRQSFPFFFDPNFDAQLHPIPIQGVTVKNNREERWDKANVHNFCGTYGDYVLSKVAKVFPELRRDVL
jgi:isopenicillin N synthase-like dioxygenase